MSEFITQDDLEAVKELLQVLASNNLSEISVTLSNGSTINLVTRSAAPVAVPQVIALPPQSPLAAQIAPSAPIPAASNLPAASAAPARDRISVPSPMVGIFYASPSPDEPAFVKPGDRIEIGQVIGLIEAMKVFSEIPSEVAGRVVEIAVASSDLVQLGQPLMYVEAV